MREIPDTTRLDMAFGNIDHMPSQDEIPDDFKRWRGNPYVDAVSAWFFSGAERVGNKLIAGGVTLTPKDGVDADKALAAVGSILRSWAPKHEHKTSACAFLLSEWFDATTDKEAAA